MINEIFFGNVPKMWYFLRSKDQELYIKTELSDVTYDWCGDPVKYNCVNYFTGKLEYLDDLEQVTVRQEITLK